MNTQDVLTIAFIVTSIKLMVGLSLWFVVKPADPNSTLPRDVARRWLAYSFLITTLSGGYHASLMVLVIKTLVVMVFFGAIAYALGYVYALWRHKRLVISSSQSAEIPVDQPKSNSKNVASRSVVFVLMALGVALGVYAVFSQESHRSMSSFNEGQESSITPVGQSSVVDQLFSQVQTFPSPLRPTNNIVNLTMGLPAEQKNEVALLVKPWIADAVKSYQDSHVAYGGSLNDLKIQISSAPAALGGDHFDALFVQLDAPGMCGSGGCSTSIAINTRNGWINAGSLFGCETLEVLTSKSNGYRDFSYSQCRSGSTYLYRFDGQRYVEN